MIKEEGNRSKYLTTNPEVVKKEFIDFAQKVEHLKNLKRELDSLDTNGFKLEERSIRSKLKDVKLIPQIIKEINSLKQKINARERKKIRASVGESAGHRALKKSDLLERKIASLEKIIDKKREVSVKKQLSKEELNFVRDIPKLERRLSDLKKTFGEHTSTSRIKVDTGVGIIVDSKFGDFISQIKSDLSKRLSEKEMVMNETLRKNLNLQKRIMAQRYGQLVEDLHKKYSEKVDKELKEEVTKRFKQELEFRLSELRRGIIEQLIREDSERLHAEKIAMARKLEEHYKERENNLVNRIESERAILREKMRDFAMKEQHILKESKIHEKNAFESKKALDNFRARELAKIKNLKESGEKKVAFVKNLVEKRLALHEAEYNQKMKAFSNHEKNALKAINQKRKEIEKQRKIHLEQIAKKRAELKKANDLERKDKMTQIASLEMQLKNKLEDAKKIQEFGKEMISSEKARLRKEIEKKRQELLRELDFRRKEHARKMELAMADLDKKSEELKKTHEMHKELLENKRRELLARVYVERKKEAEKFERLKRFETEKMQAEIQMMKKELQGRYSDKLEEMHQSMENRLEKELKAKEQILRVRLEQDFRVKLRRELRKRDLELAKKKVELEKHVFEQAKKRIDRARKLLR